LSSRVFSSLKPLNDFPVTVDHLGSAPKAWSIP
jgi:hypothetical protein